MAVIQCGRWRHRRPGRRVELPTISTAREPIWTEIPHFRTFVWVKDVNAYRDSCLGLSEGSVPLLAPSSNDRRSRWSEVLSWYGLSAKGEAKLPPIKVANAGERDLVVALDETFAVPAEAYASVFGRPFRTVADVETLEHLLSGSTYRSVLLVGTPAHFRWEFLDRMRQNLSVPWSVLTARDLAGLTFVVAKLLAAASSVVEESAFIYADHQPIVRTTDSNGRHNALERVEGKRLDTLLRRRSWYALALLAHGEGGHVNLGSTVLCGLLTDTERGMKGEAIDGCRIDGGVWRCKRATSANTRVASFGDLRTKHLGLFTCTGFSVAGEPYPSDLSGPLSATEGYPAMTLTTDRSLIIDPREPEIALGLLGQGVGPSGVRELINELQAHRSGCWPYVLYGDLYGPTPTFQTPGADGRFGKRTSGAVIPIRMDSGSPPVVADIDGTSSRRGLVRGLHAAAVVLPESESRERLRLVDRFEQWKLRTQWFKDVAARLGRAAWLERAITRVYQAQLTDSPTFQDAHTRLFEVRIRLEQHLQAGLRSCESVRRRGVWDDTVDEWTKLCTAEIKLWDSCLAELLADHLLKGNVFAILDDGFTLASRNEESSCDHCASPLMELRLAAPLEDQPHRHKTNCPLCGEQESWRAGETRLVLGELAPLRPGATAELEIDFLGPRRRLPANMPGGQLLVEVFDKARRTVFFRYVKEVTTDAQTVEVPVPSEVSAELHYLWLAWVQGLDVTLLRRRWLSLRDL